MADTNELKPCPFCGSKNVMAFARTCNKDSKYNPADRAFPIVRCRECGACSEGRDWSEPITAITKWNERATAATPLPADAALADALKEVEHRLWHNGFTQSAETVRSAAARLRALSQPATVEIAPDIATLRKELDAVVRSATRYSMDHGRAVGSALNIFDRAVRAMSQPEVAQVPDAINAVYFDVPANPKSAYVMGWNDYRESLLSAAPSAKGG